MTNLIENIVQDAAQAAPNSPALQVASAAITTAENPSASNILDDIELVVSLAKEIKTKLANVHPSLLNIFKAII